MWADLEPLGRDPRTGGYRRFAWTREDADLREWFAGEAAARGLDLVDRPGGQPVGVVGRPGRATGPGVVIGSHLDSVPDGGAFDGPLGVVSAPSPRSTPCGPAGSCPARPLGVACFVDEEGARFGVACAGSRLITGALDADRARGLTDADGVTMAEALAAAGREPERLGPRRRDAAPGRRRSSSCTSSRAGRWSTWDRRRRRRHRHLAARPLAGRPARARPTTPGTTAAGRPRRPDARLRRARCSPPAPPPLRHGCAGHRRQGARSRRTGSTRSRRRSPAWLDARAPRDDAARAVVAEVAAVADGDGGAVTEESWTAATAVRRRRWPTGWPRCSADGAAARHRRRPRRRHPRRGGHPDGDALRPQPDRASRTPPPSTPSATTAWPASPPWPRRRRPPCRVGADAVEARRRSCCGERCRSHGAATCGTGRRTRCCPDGLATGVTFDRGRRAVHRRHRRHRARRRATGCPGVVLPGFANAHCHAFHRALRGRTHDATGGTFWTWRERMYAVAARLDPDSLPRAGPRRLRRDGAGRASPPSASSTTCTTPRAAGPTTTRTRWARRWRAAAAEAGIRLTLLDTCYLAGGLGPTGTARSTGCSAASATAPPRPGRTASRRCATGRGLRDRRGGALGPRGAAGGAVAGRRRGGRAARCTSTCPSSRPRTPPAWPPTGCTPTGLLADEGVLGPATTAVHATHLTDADIALLGGTGTAVCLCPTTERDLADGIGPGPSAARRRLPARARQRPARRHRPASRSAGPWRCTSGCATGERGRFTRPSSARRARPATPPSAGRTPAASRPARAPTWSPSASTPPAPPAPTRRRCCSSPTARRRRHRASSTAGSSSAGGHHVLGDVGALLQAAIAALR